MVLDDSGTIPSRSSTMSNTAAASAAVGTSNLPIADDSGELEPIPVIRSHRLPYLPATLAGRRLDFAVDGSLVVPCEPIHFAF